MTFLPPEILDMITSYLQDSRKTTDLLEKVDSQAGLISKLQQNAQSIFNDLQAYREHFADYVICSNCAELLDRPEWPCDSGTDSGDEEITHFEAEHQNGLWCYSCDKYTEFNIQQLRD